MSFKSLGTSREIRLPEKVEHDLCGGPLKGQVTSANATAVIWNMQEASSTGLTGEVGDVTFVPVAVVATKRRSKLYDGSRVVSS